MYGRSRLKGNRGKGMALGVYLSFGSYKSRKAREFSLNTLDPFLSVPFLPLSSLPFPPPHPKKFNMQQGLNFNISLQLPMLDSNSEKWSGISSGSCSYPFLKSSNFFTSPSCIFKNNNNNN